MGALDSFLAWGGRAFSPGAWHRAVFQPILYFFLWGATVRMLVSDEHPPIRFDILAPWAATLWFVTSLTCPLLALLSWWLIAHCRLKRAALVALWIRFGADVGQLLALVTAHAATALTASDVGASEGRVYSRYVLGASIVFVMLIVVRDVWALAATERLAWRIRRRDGG